MRNAKWEWAGRGGRQRLEEKSEKPLISFEHPSKVLRSSIEAPSSHHAYITPATRPQHARSTLAAGWVLASRAGAAPVDGARLSPARLGLPQVTGRRAGDRRALPWPAGPEQHHNRTVTAPRSLQGFKLV